MSGNTLLAGLTPTPEDLAEFKGFGGAEELDGTAESIKMHLTAATAMFILASEITAAPDPLSPLGVMVRYGILDMAWYIGTSMESRDEMFSPFSSERIGSYSYSLASKKALSGEDTGIPFFDMALRWFLRDRVSDDFDFAFGAASEHVFTQPFGGTPRRLAALVHPLAQAEGGGSSEPDPVIDYIALFEEGR